VLNPSTGASRVFIDPSALALLFPSVVAMFVGWRVAVRHRAPQPSN
jgi:hypothetical protein